GHLPQLIRTPTTVGCKWANRAWYAARCCLPGLGVAGPESGRGDAPSDDRDLDLCPIHLCLSLRLRLRLWISLRLRRGIWLRRGTWFRRCHRYAPSSWPFIRLFRRSFLRSLLLLLHSSEHPLSISHRNFC